MSPVATRQPGWADSLTERASAFIDRRSSRRGFIGRTAMVGSALTVAGSTYVLKPTSAYAATCRCLGRTCNCTDLCCDGYTEFCCHLFGENSCPTNTILAGWWKVDNSSYCSGAARYYMDCNKRSPNCGCGSSGVCRGNDTTCQCRACGNRKDGCTAFRYGNCNNNVSCVGPIMCRVVTCTKPWEIDPGCTTVARTDNNTRYHHRPCLEPDPEPTATHYSLVRAFYADYLGRTASQGEYDSWAKFLARRSENARSVSLRFARSDEYINRFLNELYQSVLGRDGDPQGMETWRNQIKAGMLTSTVAVRFYASDEFFNKAGGVEGYVDAMYREILGRKADPNGRQHWIDKIDAGTPRTAVAKQFYGSTESRSKRVNKLYRRFLRRDADPQGLQTWTSKLHTNGGDDLELATFLSGSQEYENKAKQRFPNGGPAPTTTTTSTTSTTSTTTTTTTTPTSSTSSSTTTTGGDA